ncbi:outer membrane beta-barrel domain-containing protein [Cellvibrio sp.]|uniref:outer membrane beta-barrel domain-containing protein n=1 Tax=Cellvibrio sp. TaxID=1965322 RepID=UPI0039647646
MENRFQRILLAASLLCALAGIASSAFAADDKEKNNDGELGKIITPDIERRHIKEADLDSEDFEVGLYYGMLSVEDFGSNPVVGVTFAYHITEDLFAQLNYATSETQKTSYELLSGGVELLTKDQRDLSYYNISLGYNLLPGQVYISDKWHFNTGFYFIGGAGNTKFAEKNYFTYNLGAGFKFYATDWLMADLGVRDYSFKHELFGVSKKTNNLETRLGISLFF